MNKKVLLISSGESYFFGPLKRALQELGYEVHLGDYLGHPVLSRKTLIHKVTRRMPRRMREFIIGHAQARTDQKIVRLARELAPDFILVSKSKYLGLDTLDTLRGVSPLVNWYPETMNNWGSITKIVGHYDYFFSYDRYVVGLLKEMGHANVYHLPFGVELARTATWPDRKTFKYDVIFLGSYDKELYPERELFLDAIKDLGLKVFGNSAWLDTTLKEHYQGPITPELTVIKELYASSRIVIHTDLQTKIVPGTGVTLRPYDVASSGALLVAHDDRPELAELFKDGEEFVSFHGPDDLREKVKYYLEHEEERRAIARAGFEGVRLRHTYVDRIRTIIDTIHKYPVT